VQNAHSAAGIGIAATTRPRLAEIVYLLILLKCGVVCSITEMSLIPAPPANLLALLPLQEHEFEG